MYISISPSISLALALTLSWPVPAAAAPATDPSSMGPASVAFTEAENRLEAGDPDGAVERFEAGLELLPEERGYAPTRAHVLLTIVDAHEAAFKKDGDLERLRRAKQLLDRYLGPLDLLDEQGRADAEARRVVVINTILMIEQRRRSEAAAQSLEMRRKAAEMARRRGRALTLAGSALVGVGAAGIGTMAAGFGLGRAADDNIEALKAQKAAEGDDWSLPCVDDLCREARRRELDPLVSRGNTGNLLVIVGAATGGVLLVGGLALLLVGRKSKRQAKQLELSPSLSANAWGPGLKVRF